MEIVLFLLRQRDGYSFFLGIMPSFIHQMPQCVRYKLDYGVGQTRHDTPDQEKGSTWLDYVLHH